MESFSHFLEIVNSYVWGAPLIVFIFGMHIFLTIKTGFIQRKLFYAIKLSITKEKGSKGDISPFASLSVAMASTVGTGNIAGVATAITLGGPGAIFWMWIAGILGISTKYAESLLAVKYRVKKENGLYAGGPMYTIENGMGKKFKWLAVFFAVCTAIAAFGIGNMVQVNTLASVLKSNYAIPNWFTGASLAVTTGLVIIGGVKGIARTSTAIMPFIIGAYIVICLILMLINFENVPSAIALILSDAFHPTSAAGGFAGATLASTMRFGIARGLFSNESGLGSAPMIAAAAKTSSQVRQGLVSSTGTFWDTGIMCAIMGLILVASGAWNFQDTQSQTVTGAQMTAVAFSQLGTLGAHALAIIISAVVISTVFGWSYYGERAFEYLFGVKVIVIYRLLWVAAVVVGSVLTLGDVFNFADIANGLMAVPNLISLLVLSGVVSRETKSYFSRMHTEKLEAKTKSESSNLTI